MLVLYIVIGFIIVFSVVFGIVRGRPSRQSLRRGRRFRKTSMMNDSLDLNLDLVESATFVDQKKRPIIIDDSLDESEDVKESIPLASKIESNKSLDSSDSGVVMLHVMAPLGAEYSGYGLLQSLLSNGLRYGDMKIFHRYQNASGHGLILFSLASVQKPGTFELSEMGHYACPGLILFMHFPKSFEGGPPLHTIFDTMWETAQQLCDDLGGEIWDEERHLITEEKIENIRTRLIRIEQNERAYA
jgi:cell division protein ZipA